jgi:hypothetical protein
MHQQEKDRLHWQKNVSDSSRVDETWELPQPHFHFDEECNLRILNAPTRERSIALAKECQRFVSKVNEFQKVVELALQETNEMAEATERQKDLLIMLLIKQIHAERLAIECAVGGSVTNRSLWSSE